ncbi:predicted protein [Sclerotinia sclerotiorum 1980 UF-70]|uniref:Uncharacterized protein n=2 Tax=Sclerotinia sclerotiorum (strain ATCC 18683 / 1980 / Ss-1) TaxID=665079 RepID=A7F8X5_SCLS1|nr:predicted protein [Sclerotinia sclerotiorum 1980 UF-70]APA13156.1 hypothetical protein sscle_10g079260 [Sclerotinia sclerotiorum 1980 UF-70]EDN99196.1 predicted protein [Sclerotinia sclerotiorum 1980 UF-70]
MKEDARSGELELSASSQLPPFLIIHVTSGERVRRVTKDECIPRLKSSVYSLLIAQGALSRPNFEN